MWSCTKLPSIAVPSSMKPVSQAAQREHRHEGEEEHQAPGPRSPRPDASGSCRCGRSGRGRLVGSVTTRLTDALHILLGGKHLFQAPVPSTARAWWLPRAGQGRRAVHRHHAHARSPCGPRERRDRVRKSSTSMRDTELLGTVHLVQHHHHGQAQAAHFQHHAQVQAQVGGIGHAHEQVRKCFAAVAR